jgi:TadE-like protein
MRGPATRRDTAAPSDRGGVIAEYAAIFPIVLIVILICFEALMAAVTVERVENAARTGARVASQQRNAGACRGAALDAMPRWINDRSVDAGRSFDSFSCHVRAEVPLLWPGAPITITVDRTVRMPVG